MECFSFTSLRRGVSLWVLIAFFTGLGGAIQACKPTVEAGDPVGLTWDEAPQDGMTKLLKLSRATGIKVMFWNVAWSSLNDGNVIEKNLAEIIVSNARPHLLVLAEFKPDAVPAAEMDFLKQQYPAHQFVPYEPGDSVGIQIFAESEFMQGPNEPIDWAPPSAPESDAKDYKADWYKHSPKEVTHWDRAYSRFTWEIAGHRLNLVPVHLLEPWVAFKDRYGEEASLKNLFFGGDNPLTHQIRHLRMKLRRDFGENLDSEPLLLLGDFNVPKKALSKGALGVIEVPAYTVLSRDLEEVFPGTPFTFPAFSSPERQRPPFKYTYVKIDHALMNRHFEPVGAGVLPLRGSDHYPIYFVIKPKK